MGIINQMKVTQLPIFQENEEEDEVDDDIDDDLVQLIGTEIEKKLSGENT